MYVSLFLRCTCVRTYMICKQHTVYTYAFQQYSLLCRSTSFYICHCGYSVAAEFHSTVVCVCCAHMCLYAITSEKGHASKDTYLFTFIEKLSLHSCMIRSYGLTLLISGYIVCMSSTVTYLV